MLIKEAKFSGSCVSVKDCPKPLFPEYAFIGRSNVGKSSLINMLTGRRALAKISNTPGKTQTINHFFIDDHWFLVDLPGYGYAKISKTSRVKWEKMIRDYMLKRENLVCVFVLIDARHEPQKLDLEFINWLGEMKIPFVLVFTKSDKLSPKNTKENIELFKKEMKKKWTSVPQTFVTSAVKKEGKEDILNFIEELNGQFTPSE